ncbi:hypothetical protein BC941DRAFT_496382 [Chlamydoabsidia padenii]|nr:hypothetical protein BC941DRAFT_496382 [Chlamydoabsidia padenii]
MLRHSHLLLMSPCETFPQAKEKNATVRITLPTLTFETPNLYKTSLKLSKEINIHNWWATVVELFTSDSFRASRVTLCIPQDASDPYNGPWGLKAVYDNTSNNKTNNNKTDSNNNHNNNENVLCTPEYFNINNITQASLPSHSTSTKSVRQCFERLQSLDSDPVPLINQTSIQQVLRRKDIIVLSREYRSQSTSGFFAPRSYVKKPWDEHQDMIRRTLLEKRSSLRQSVNSEIHSMNQEGPSSFMMDYDEYEQQQPSPWSHSPAPSPALMDLDINPFFQSVPDIDDDAFNPDSSEFTCTNSTIAFPPPASNAHSLIHIPIVHPPDFDDNNNNKTTTRSNHQSQCYPTPIAILSFLSPVVPYPVVLLKCLRSLQAFIATSLSNALAYSRMVQSRFNTDPSSAGKSGGRKPLLRRHSHKIKRWPSQTFGKSTDGFSDTSSTCSFSSSNQKPTHLDNNTISSSSTLPSSHPYPSPDDDDDDQVTSSTNSKRSHQQKVNEATTSSSGQYRDLHQQKHGPRITVKVPPHHGRTKKYRKQHGSVKRRNSAMATFMGPRPRRASITSASEDHRRYVTIRHTRSSEIFDKYLYTPRSTLLRLVIDGIPIHVFTCSTTTGQITWVNNRILQYTGKAMQEHLGPGWLSHMHPDDQTDFRQAWENAFKQGNGFAGEYRLRRFDGVYRGFLWRIVPLRDTKGKIIHWFGTCTDVHDQQLAKENNLRQMEIESNERKYRLLADAIPQIVFTFSPGIGLTYANGKWEKYSSQPFDRTQGLGFMSQVHPDDRHKLQLPDLSPHKTAGVAWHSEIRLLGGDGSYRWFLVKCISVDELDTGEVRWFGTCTDINDHKLLEHKLKEAHNAAQKSTESKTRFLSNMSHEIRTPLIGITGMLNFLLDTDLTVEQLDYAHTIQQSAESLLVVINDILDLSKVEAGMMKLSAEPFSLVTMIEDANELLSTLAIQKGLELSFWVDDDVPAVVKGDRVRLRQVLLNLIGNAIKFTTYGEIYTRCKIQSKAEDNSEILLLFEVLDTGTGFDSDGEAVMFKPFSQIDSSSTRKHGGSGLGLVISRQLIELHGGEMKCSGEKGVGSTFSFTAKFDIPKANTRPLPQTPQHKTMDPFFRTDAYKVVHDQTYRQELLHQQQKQQEQHLETTTSTNNQNSRSSNNNDLGQFSPSPLAHSKKHSQTNELAPSCTDRFQDALINKPINMQLKPPPKRKQPSSPASLKECVLPPSIPDTPTIALHKSTHLVTPITSFNSPDLIKELTTTTNPSATRDLMSANTAIILPPRTPTRLAPLRTLIVCEWNHSRNTMERHVRRIIHQLCLHQHYTLDIAANYAEAQTHLSASSGGFDYILINLRSEQHILALTSSICDTPMHCKANIMIVTTPIQRSLLMEYTSSDHYRHREVIPKSCGFVFKPLKRSKLNWYFGIRNEPGATRNDPYSASESSHRSASTQKEIFRKMEADVGGKGFRILLVEDNLVNQKVLTRYLLRVGLVVDVANDGEEFVNYFTKKPYGYYSLVLCDLFMPVKDGFEATQEIREWEETNLNSEQRRIPIVALSANVIFT